MPPITTKPAAAPDPDPPGQPRKPRQPRQPRLFTIPDDLGITIIHQCGPFCGHRSEPEQDIDLFNPALREEYVPARYRLLWRSVRRRARCDPPS